MGVCCQKSPALTTAVAAPQVNGKPNVILRAELEAAGLIKPVDIPDVEKWAAHHIVPADSPNPDARIAQDILSRNGFWDQSCSEWSLVTNEAKEQSTVLIEDTYIATHNGYHVAKYISYVKTRIEPYDGNPSAIVGVLDDIRLELLTANRRLGNLDK